jgi:hypothetical protein
MQTRLNRSLAIVASSLCLSSGVSGQSTAALPVWTLSSAPLLRIGDDNEPAKQFGAIIGAARLSTGEIVVEERDSRELRVFSPAGMFIKALSRKGQGPGEFDQAGPLFRTGDTLIVAENPPGARQLHIFARASGFVGRVPIRAAGAGSMMARGRLSDGKYLVQAGGGFRALPEGLQAGQLSRDTVKLGLFSPRDSGSVRWLGEFPASTFFTYVSPFLGGRVSLAVVTLAPGNAAVASGSRVWIGDSGTGVITIFDAQGARVAQFNFPAAPRPLTEEIRERGRKFALDGARTDQQRAMTEARWAKDAVPKNLPFFSSFVAGTGGEVWIQETPDDPAAATRFVVFGATGAPVGRVVVPARVTLHEIGRDYVLGVAVDSDGAEHLVQYGLQRR